MTRFLLFSLTNIAVLLVLTVVMEFFGVRQWLVAQGVPLDMAGYLIPCVVIGFGGAIISLMMSKTMAIHGTRARVISEPANNTEAWLVTTVERQARQAGIGMPDVAIFNSPQPNAFATGARRDSALVAVSTGLLENMTQDEVEAVLGHEVAHVANGDMITMTLIQGVLNVFVMLAARIVGSIIDRAVFKSDRGHGPGYFVSVLVLQVVFGMLASIVVSWFSRYREFRADEGGASLAGRQKMIAALRRLSAQRPAELPEQLAAFGIFGSGKGGFRALFATHPPLETRIAALERGGV